MTMPQSTARMHQYGNALREKYQLISFFKISIFSFVMRCTAYSPVTLGKKLTQT